MTRPTLKLKKPLDPAAPPKATTSRAKRAQQLGHRSRSPVAAPPPEPPPAPSPPGATAPHGKARTRTDRTPDNKARPRGKGAPFNKGAPGNKDAPFNKARSRRDGTPDNKAAPFNKARSRRDGTPDNKAAPLNRAGSRKDGAPDNKAMPFNKARSRKDGAPGNKPAPYNKPSPYSKAVPRDQPAPDSNATPQRSNPEPAAPAHENPDDPRLSKLMSERGLCSRREADEWIENGWVKVNGQVIATLGVRVPREARIDIDAEARRHQGEQVTILLNKPVGYVSGQPEDGYQPAIVLIKPENRWSEDPSPLKFRPSHLRGLAPAGRLDIDSTGLLVFTQDGRVAKRLIGQDSEVEKEYLVRVEGTLTDEGMAMLHHGIELDGVRLKPAKVSWQNENQLRFVLREGRKRQIRRMCERVGLEVVALKRVRSGGVPLGPLPVGQWRYLRRDEKF